MKKGIIFDLDGTLWDTAEKIIPAWNSVLRKHGQSEITYEDMSGYMGKTGEVIACLMMPELSQAEALRIFKECCEAEQDYLRENGGILYDGLEAVLKALAKDYSLSIVSNCHPEYLNAFFEAHGLKKYFEDYECHGNTGLSKAENIKLITERGRLDKALYVGDTSLDLESAEMAGVPFVYADYGFGSIRNTKYRINSLYDLPKTAGKVFE